MHVVLSCDMLNGRTARTSGLLCPQALAIEHPAIQHIITVPTFSNLYRDVIHRERRKGELSFAVFRVSQRTVVTAFLRMMIARDYTLNGQRKTTLVALSMSTR